MLMHVLKISITIPFKFKTVDTVQKVKAVSAKVYNRCMENWSLFMLVLTQKPFLKSIINKELY